MSPCMKAFPGIVGVLLLMVVIVFFPGAARAQQSTRAFQNNSSSSGWVPNRRRDQFYKQFGYYMVPAPYNIEGLGQGVVAAGSISNIGDTPTDLGLVGFSGALKGWSATMMEYELLEEHLLLDLMNTDWKDFAVNIYPTRGMNTVQKDYVNVAIPQYNAAAGRLTLTFWERRIELSAYILKIQMKQGVVKDSAGVQLQDLSLNAPFKVESQNLGLFLDFTDDYQDPRKGVRLYVGNAFHPRMRAGDPEFGIVDANLTGYFPLGKKSTWVFNLFQSQANVTSPGETNLATLANQLGCPGQQAACMGVVYNTLAANQNGTATSLGGQSRLRSYSMGRFNGGVSAFVGSEMRLNFSDEPEPMDIFIIRDVKLAMQWALFCEAGSVAETAKELWQRSRSSCGTGLRIVAGSGLVYRMDYAAGNEGGGMTMLVGYPWENL
ncbi:MAG: outer membrane protein assembly factor [Deltaproteobacteria bacterium]|nr:outer membrane protein assembly factor [Deltaproteobacteria bacterium]